MPSRVRFVLVEAEGDIALVTQAIQNAFRTPQGVQPKRIGSTKIGTATPEEAQPEFDFESEVEDADQVETEESSSPPSRARASRKPAPTPDVVLIDMNAAVSLVAFAQGKDARSQHKKYLIAAAWLKEHRGVSGVTADHIYTCFRSMEWPTNIPDFWQPLRDLKARKFFIKNERNEYEINHLGLDYVKKLGGQNGAG
jgi:hypothetical protein